MLMGSNIHHENEEMKTFHVGSSQIPGVTILRLQVSIIKSEWSFQTCVNINGRIYGYIVCPWW